MKINEYNVVAIEYSLKDANTNEQLDTNVGGKPLEFITGMGQIIKGLEAEILKMTVGDKADVMVAPADGYGEYNDQAVQVLPKEQFAGIDLVQGMTLYGTSEEGDTVQVTVTNFDDNEVTIDYNHPMAGKTLMFTVSILDAREATDQEMATGVVGGVASGGCCGGGSCGSSGGHSHGHSHGEGECCGGENHKHGGQGHGGCGCH
ncbi:FKBP-type peptidyl-prolyl cis-trans isomerase [Arcobacter sp. FWKO B]|uniref:FKBP-type peptidyl-prolyl cis-trans isomerase n=1 Tax=Arcobacter sp. FWKO B TaxID=2593672 RepID=UPI0018A43A42|nr:peptidylprolyl isomerase [Arcobacter sp. FWKO B]QOG11753.1 peptidylprolyl isomerase [Arcobacter sp. FWKO B]